MSTLNPIFQNQQPQKVQIVGGVALDVDSNSPLLVDFDPSSDMSTGTRIKVAQEDPTLHSSVLAMNTSADGKMHIILDSVVCRWVDSNNVYYHEIYPIGFIMYDVSDVMNGINLNSFLGAYKGLIESIVQTGTTFSITLNYHTVSYDRHVTWLNYGQTFTKQ